MNIKRSISFFPPKWSARAVSVILAFLITIGGFKCFELIFKNGFSEKAPNAEPSSDVAQNAHPDDTQTSVDIEESREIIKTEDVLSITYGVSAESAVLYNITKNEMVCEKNMNYQVGVGDYSVFMTALITADKIDKGELKKSDMAVCPSAAARQPNYALSSEIYSVGQRLDIETLLKCMLYQRGSSFAYSLAVHISGSEEEFVAEMNAFAEALGLKSTRFTNVCGQDDGVSKITAYEAAVIIKAFFENEMLSEMFRSNDPVIIRKNGTQSSVYLTVSNDFFEVNCTPNQAAADGIKGGKIGYLGYLNWGIMYFYDGVYSYAAITLCSPAAFADSMQIYARREAPDN